MYVMKIPPHDFLLKMQGGLMREGGTYLWDTTVLLITYCTSCAPKWGFISSIWNCDHMMKMLYYTIHCKQLHAFCFSCCEVKLLFENL